ncbi:hypothetical protein BGZ98_000505 [Dissophora globulifera]|nr:hypothetical protein BGZ98_000505 [Dissophora globulifera]
MHLYLSDSYANADALAKHEFSHPHMISSDPHVDVNTANHFPMFPEGCQNYNNLIVPPQQQQQQRRAASMYNTVNNQWDQFLQSQYNPQPPHGTVSQGSSKRFSAPTPVKSQSCGPLMLSSNERDYLRPRLSQAAVAHAAAAAARAQLRSERSMSVSSTTSSCSSLSSWSSWTSENENDCENDQEVPYLQQVVRKNKALPPPTLSPILMPTRPKRDIRRTLSRLSVSSSSSDSDSSTGSGYSYSSCGSDSEDEQLLSAEVWPTMDKLPFSTFDRAYHDHPSNDYNDTHHHYNDNESFRSKFVSELPPPTSLTYDHDDCFLNHDNRKYLALSASIWGPGWHQVEPLPESFVRTMQQTELEAQDKAQALAQEKAAQAATNPKTKAKKAKQQAKAARAIARADAATSSSAMTLATTTTTTASASGRNSLCSARLPRSLHFVD